MLYSTLCQRHPDYAPDLWGEYSLLYHGGHRLRAAMRSFVPRMSGEHDARYEQRLTLASYVNHFGPIVGYFLSNLFAQELTMKPAADADDPTTVGSAPIDDGFWSLFGRDVDRCGAPLSKLLRSLLKTTLVQGKALVCADFPAAVAAPGSLAEEDALGIRRGYAYKLPNEQLIDWSLDDHKRFTLAVIHRVVSERHGLEGNRDTRVEEFKCWEMGQDGRAAWRLFRSRPMKAKEQLKDDDDIPEVDGGSTSFRQIPIVEMQAPAGCWIGDHIGAIAREHLQRRSNLISAEADSLCAIPYAKLGPEMGAAGEAIPSEAQQNPSRGNDQVGQFRARGWIAIGKDDDIGFAEPSGRCYEITHKGLDSLVDEMYRVNRQMAQTVASNTTLGRSGLSKQEDRHATEIVLGELGACVRDCAKRLYTLISEARGENVVWTPHGLDKYELVDREALLEEADGLDMVAIPSPTFHKAHKTKMALALLGNVEPDTQDAIRAEIEAGVDEAEEQRKAMPPPGSVEHMLARALTNNGQPAKQPGKPARAGAGQNPPQGVGGRNGAPAAAPPSAQ